MGNNSLRVLFLAGCLLLCSCSRYKQPGGAAGKKTSDYGDTYVDTLLGDATYLNPLLASDNASSSVNNLVFNGLVKYDRDIKMVGDLAESWTVSSGGREIIFRLRRNVRWHDGKPFTSRDVKFTYDMLVASTTKTPYSSDFMLVESVSAPDPYTFKVFYREPFAPALESWGMGILPEHVFAAKGADFNSHPANQKPVGTGPYRFTEWKTDEKILLSANTDYFEGRPFIDKVLFRVIPDQSVQFLELRNESLDSMGLTPDEYKAYDEFFLKYNKFRYPAFAYTYLGFNLNHPYFKDRRVREAIAHSLNKKELIDGVLLGIGKPATGPFVPQSWAYDPGIVDYAYDLAKARELLGSAGWKDADGDGILENTEGKKFEFTLITNQGNKIRQLAAEIMQSQLMKIGIKLNIRIIEWSAFIQEFVNKKNFDAVILGWTVARDPDQFAIWHSGQTREGQYNFVSYRNPEVDRLLIKGRTTFDQKQRQDIYRRIHRLIFNDIPYVFLYYPESLPVVHKRFRNAEVAPAGLGWNFIKWYAPGIEQKY